MKVLARGVIFADLAVEQIAGLGVVLAGLLDLTGQPLLVQKVKSVTDFSLFYDGNMHFAAASGFLSSYQLFGGIGS